MIVIVMECASESIRGELTRWFLELKPGVFVGNVNARIRELLWKRICETDAAIGSVMVFSARNEQGFEMKVFGDPRRKVTDFEGIQLITVALSPEDRTETIGLPEPVPDFQATDLSGSGERDTVRPPEDFTAL